MIFDEDYFKNYYEEYFKYFKDETWTSLQPLQAMIF